MKFNNTTNVLQAISLLNYNVDVLTTLLLISVYLYTLLLMCSFPLACAIIYSNIVSTFRVCAHAPRVSRMKDNLHLFNNVLLNITKVFWWHFFLLDSYVRNTSGKCTVSYLSASYRVCVQWFVLWTFACPLFTVAFCFIFCLKFTLQLCASLPSFRFLQRVSISISISFAIRLLLS